MSTTEEILLEIAQGSQPAQEPAAEDTPPAPAEEINTDAVVVEEAPTDPNVEDGGTETPGEGDSPEGVESGVTEDSTETVDEDSLPEVIEDWDLDEDDDPDDSATEVDYGKLAKEIGIEANSLDEIKSKFDKMKSRMDELAENAQKASVLDTIPEKLKEAIDYASQGGDYIEYLKITSIDYSKVDPVALYEKKVATHFYDDQGNFDSEGFNEYMDEIPAKEVEIRGKQLRSQLAVEQERDLLMLNEKKERIKTENGFKLKTALDKVDNIGGFKINEEAKRDLYSSLSSANYEKELFKDSKGNMDYEKAIKSLFVAKNFDKINSFLKTKIKNHVTKETIAEIGNHTVSRPAQRPNVEPTNTDPLDLLISDAKKSFSNIYEGIQPKT